MSLRHSDLHGVPRGAQRLLAALGVVGVVGGLAGMRQRQDGAR